MIIGEEIIETKPQPLQAYIYYGLFLSLLIIFVWSVTYLLFWLILRKRASKIRLTIYSLLVTAVIILVLIGYGVWLTSQIRIME